MAYIDSQHPRLQRSYAVFAYVRVPFSLISTTYIFPLLLLTPNLKQCGNASALPQPRCFSPYNTDSDYRQELDKFVSPVFQTFTHLYQSNDTACNSCCQRKGDQRSLLFTGLGESGNLLAPQRRSTVSLALRRKLASRARVDAQVLPPCAFIFEIRLRLGDRHEYSTLFYCSVENIFTFPL